MSTAHSAAHTIVRAAEHASDADFADEALPAVGSVVPHDGYCLFGVDPVSGLRSFMLSRNGLDGVAARLTHNERVEHDVNRYADLAAARVPVGILGGGGREPASPRLHEILRPAGVHSELRLVLRSRTSWWGALTLFRSDRRAPFTVDDVTTATELSGPLATALRRRQVRRSLPRQRPLSAGTVLLDARDTVVGMSDEARAWLRDLCAGGSDEMSLDDILRVVYDTAHAARADADGRRAVCRIRTSSGRWLVVQGNRIDSGPADVAVVLQPASLGQVLPAASAWLGLTPREGEVLALVADGRSSQQVSSQLGMSLLTVGTHLRSVYRKADVPGRDELLSRLS